MPLVESIVIQDGATATLRQIDSALDATVQRVGRLSIANDNLTKASGSARFAVQNLSFQLNDIATSLASGGSPLRVLAQQGGQIIQVFQQGGGVSAVLGATRTAIAGMITPTTAAVAGVTALAAGFGALLLRAQASSEALRQYNLVAAQMGRSGATDLTGENNRLRSLGITSDVASAQRLALTRNPMFATGVSERFQTLGANVGAFLGTGPEGGFSSLMQAIQGGPEATIRFAVSINALSVSAARALIESSALTGGIREMNIAVAAAETKMNDFAKNAMGPMAEATNTFGAAWDRMLTGLSKTGPIETARSALIDLMNAIGGQHGAGGPRLGRIESDVPAGSNAFMTGIRRFWSFMNPPYDTAAREQSLRDAAAGPRWFDQPITRGPFLPGSILGGANAGIVSAAERLRQQIAEYEATRAEPSGGLWRSAGQIAGGGWSGRWNMGGGAMVTRDPQKELDVAKAIDQQRRANSEAIPVQRLWNVEQEAAQAALAKKNELLAMGATADEAAIGAALAAAAARAKHNTELGKENTLRDMAIAGDLKVVEALKQSEQAAIAVTAAEQARIEVLQRGGDVSQRTAQILEANAAKTAIDLQRSANENERRIELVNLEASLQGQTAEHIAKQVTLLQAKQELERRGVEQTGEIAQNYLKSAEALGDANARAASLAREQSRIEDMVRSVASTVENSLGRVFDDIFSGRRVTDWGQQFRSILGSLLGDIVKFTLIRPAIGTALGAVGFGSLAQQYGSFGGGSSPFSLSNISSGASLANSLGGGSGFLGGIGSWLNTSIGPSLGFALPGVGAAGIPMASAPLFGGLTLTGALPFLGIAAAGGMLLSQLFGNKKPSNASAGGLIDLSTGLLNGSFTGGNSQIDSSTSGLLNTVSTFTQNLLRLTGGTLSGNVLLQGGVNTGFTADSTLPGFVGRFGLGRDPTAAANMTMLAIARSVTGVSSAMEQFLATVSDPQTIMGVLEMTSALKDFGDSLRKGPLSGAPLGQQLAEARAQFDATFALVQSGRLEMVGTLQQQAQTTLALSTQVYGNGPQTAGLRTDILAAIDSVLADRSFASGGVTPPGMIRVGEHGPEWMWQPGGAIVYPAGTVPANANDPETTALLRQVVQLLSAGNRIAQGVGVETVGELKTQTAALDKPAMEPMGVRRTG